MSGLLLILVLLFPNPVRAEADPPERARALNQKVLQLHREGRDREALPLAEEALSLTEEALGGRHRETATLLTTLGVLRRSLGDHDRAKKDLQKALSIRENAYGPRHLLVAASLNELAKVYFVTGDYWKAEPLLKRTLGIREDSLGKTHPDVATTLNDLAALYHKRAEYNKALPLYKRALEIHEAILDPEHPTLAAILYNLGTLYRRARVYGKSEPMYRRALAIWEKKLGPDHPRVEDVLHDLALLYNATKQYDRAASLYRRVLTLREKRSGKTDTEVISGYLALGEIQESLQTFEKAEATYREALDRSREAYGADNPNTALVLDRLARVRERQGDFAGAEALVRQAISIHEKSLGREDAAVAADLVHLAKIFHALAKYEKAEPLLLRALDINEKAFEPHHPAVAPVLVNLAETYMGLGDYRGAESHIRRSLEIWERAFGPVHPNVALSLNNLAGFYSRYGEYDKAEPLLNRALGAWESMFGKDHPYVAGVLRNQADWYMNIGDRHKAAALLERALEIDEAALAPDHPNRAAGLKAMAGYYFTLGEDDRALPLMERALAMDEKALGKENPTVARDRSAVALLCKLLGQYERAGSHYVKALDILGRLFGPEHPALAPALSNLGLFYVTTGDHARAEPLLLRSLTLWEESLGKVHPQVSQALKNLAGLYAAAGQYTKARDILLEAMAVDERLLRAVPGFTSEDRKVRYLANVRRDLYAFLSLVSRHLREDPKALGAALNAWLTQRGIVLEVRKRFRESRIPPGRPGAMETFKALSGVEVQIARLVFAGPGRMGPAHFDRKLKALEKQRADLEQKLARPGPVPDPAFPARSAGWQGLQKALPRNAALLLFARVPMVDYKALRSAALWRPARYLVFVLGPGRGGPLLLRDLGPARDIDRMVDGFRKTLADPERAGEAAAQAKALGARVFEPLRKDLKGVERIFVCPDGPLGTLPMEVMQGADGRFLVEEYAFVYLASGVNLAGFNDPARRGEKNLVMGDPAFDVSPGREQQVRNMLGLDGDGEGPALGRSPAMNALRFPRVSASRKEARAVYRLLGEDRTSLYTGHEALEELLKQRPRPGVVHLATRCFFLPDQDWEDLPDMTEGGVIQQVSLLLKRGGVVRLDNPLRRSGFVLAAANNALKKERSRGNDGIVTAEEILGLDLRGTDLVFLSNRDTETGDGPREEALSALWRAFFRAGTRSLVMALWSPPEEEALELVTRFYENLRAGGTDRCEALRQAALKQMAAVKTRYGHAHPLYWGAYIFLGQP